MKRNSIEWLKAGCFEDWIKRNQSSIVKVDCVDYRSPRNHEHKIFLNVPEDCDKVCTSDCSFFGLCKR